jgi:predicted ATPase
MERLVIKNFLILEDIDFEVKKFNIIIGSQGTGKSLIAKVLYFFRQIGTSLKRSLIKKNGLEKAKESIIDDFKKFFPFYSWSTTEFSIQYYFADTQITLQNSADTSPLQITFSDSIEQSYAKTLDAVNSAQKTRLEEQDNLVLDDHSNFMLRIHLEREIISNLKAPNTERATFIPASRAFFSLVNENIFSLLSTDQKLDPLLVQFGASYEQFKRIYNNIMYDEQSIEGSFTEKNQTSFLKCSRALSTRILGGTYQKIDETDWIIGADFKKTELVHTSSGQQEALPLIIMLSVLHFIERKGFTFIEEPEAHLFPESQADMLSIISSLYSSGESFFITTHSPYILSELNNFIYAKELCKSNILSKEQFEAINNFGCPVDFDDVSAYAIENGRIRSILDQDYKLIQSNELDKASEHAEIVFNTLLELDSRGHTDE